VDLVSAFSDIGLTNGEAESTDASYDSGRPGSIGDFSVSTFDHLHRYYIVSRGGGAPPSQGD